MEDFLRELYKIKVYFKDTKYQDLLDLCERYYEGKDFDKLSRTLKKFPTEEQLFESLVEQLKGKSVYGTLKEMSEGKTNKLDEIKGISSLITHTVIQMEEEPEYRMLIPILAEKLDALVYNL